MFIDLKCTINDYNWTIGDSHCIALENTLFLICFGVSVRNIAELSSLADIFVDAPCKAGINIECISAGLQEFNLGATSLVILKYGS